MATGWGKAVREELTKAAFMLALAGAFVVLMTTPEARASYEPNDTLSTAAGPVSAGQPIQAAIGSLSDADFFFFYATGTTPTTVTLANLGGSTEPTSEINARIVDSLGAYAGGDFTYVRKGESRTSSVGLKPGKYFVEITGRDAQGDMYQLSPGIEGDLFQPYGEIAARCASATATVGALRRGVDRAKTKLQRAVSRVRRSRYASPRSRRAAQALRSRAKARLLAKQRALKSSSQARHPWCFIPQ